LANRESYICKQFFKLTFAADMVLPVVPLHHTADAVPIPVYHIY